jgi:hypothetical protein
MILRRVVRAGEQRRWDFEAKYLGGLEVDYQLVLGRCLHRQVGRLLALEDAIDVASCLPVLIDLIRPVGDQAAGGGEGTLEVDGGQPVLGSKLDNQLAMNLKPVALPPGRARLWTKPAPTGSATAANTIGTVRVTFSNGPRVEAPVANMTSGARATNSAAFLRTASALAVAQRVSIRTLRPSVQPNCCQVESPRQQLLLGGFNYRWAFNTWQCGQQRSVRGWVPLSGCDEPSTAQAPEGIFLSTDPRAGRW